MKKNYLAILVCLVLALPTLAQDAEKTQDSAMHDSAAMETTDGAAASQGEAMTDEQAETRRQNLQTSALDIQETFSLYRQAITDQNAEEALGLVTQGTLDYFKELRELALYATPDELEKRDLTDRMQVVVLRHRVPMSTLGKKDHIELLKFCIETGLLGKSVSAVELSEIRLKDEQAEAQTVLNGQPLPVILKFSKEGEAWKIDMLSILSAGNEMLRGIAEQKGMTEDDLILDIVTKGSGLDVPKEIWLPPLTRDGVAKDDSDSAS